MNLVRTAPVWVALSALGCASAMNGVSDKLTATSPTPGARVFVDGFDATQQAVVVPNDRPHVLLVRAPGYADVVVPLEPHVKAAPIVLDVLLAVPTLLIAPLVDLCTGWWGAIDAPDQPIALALSGPAIARPRPTYGLATPPAPAPSAVDPATPPPPTAATAMSVPPVPAPATPVAKAPAPAAPVAKAPAAAAPEKAHVVAAATPTAVPAAKTTCDPNFEFDDQGRKHFKPACFLSPKK